MPIGWGIVSTGRHADAKMAPAINAAAGSAMAAIVSGDAARARDFADKHGVAKAYDDLDAMLGDRAVHVVYVASPNSLHAEHTLQAAAAGKHVLVERPIAISPVGAARVVEAARAARVCSSSFPMGTPGGFPRSDISAAAPEHFMLSVVGDDKSRNILFVTLIYYIRFIIFQVSVFGLGLFSCIFLPRRRCV